MESNSNKIRINEWIQPLGMKFEYLIFWPYADNLLEIDELVDVQVKLDRQEKKYVGTFTTINDLKRRFERSKINGECAQGTYQPLKTDNELLLEKISHDSIEKTINDLVSKEEFFRYFERVDE